KYRDPPNRRPGRARRRPARMVRVFRGRPQASIVTARPNCVNSLCIPRAAAIKIEIGSLRVTVRVSAGGERTSTPPVMENPIMAISAGFKQACPSCEALVPIKDARMIGRKIDCPRCKYRFVVEEPAAAAKDEDADAADEAIQDRSAKTAKNGKAKPPVDDVDEVDEVKETKAKAVPAKGKSNGKAAPVKKKLRDAEDDDDAD